MDLNHCIYKYVYVIEAIWLRNLFSIHLCVHGIGAALNPRMDFWVIFGWPLIKKIKKIKKIQYLSSLLPDFFFFLNLVCIPDFLIP